MGDDVMDVEVVASATAAAALRRRAEEETMDVDDGEAGHGPEGVGQWSVGKAAVAIDADALPIAMHSTMQGQPQPQPHPHPHPPLTTADSSTHARSLLDRARQVVSGFLKEHLAEELIPETCRVVLVTSELPLKNAFQAMLDNGLSGVPVWDSRAQQYLGMLTVTDLIQFLQYLYSNVSDPSAVQELVYSSVSRWKAFANSPHRSLTVADAEGSLYEACCKLRDNKMRRLPILSVNPRMVLHVLTHSTVLHFVHKRLRLRGYGAKRGPGRGAPADASLSQDQGDDLLSALFDMTLGQLEIGTYHDMQSVTYSTRVIHALQLLFSRELSALPVVDINGVGVDVYSRADVTELARDFKTDSLRLDSTIQETLAQRRGGPFELHTCSRSDTLRDIFEKFDSCGKHRLYCINDRGILQGVVSLSDVLGYFVAE